MASSSAKFHQNPKDSADLPGVFRLLAVKYVMRVEIKYLSIQTENREVLKLLLLLVGDLTDGQGHFTLKTENKVITLCVSPSAQNFKLKYHPFCLLLNVILQTAKYPDNLRIKIKEESLLQCVCNKTKHQEICGGKVH